MDNNNPQNPIENDMNVLAVAKEKKKTIIMVAVICAVLLIIGLIWWLVSSSGSKKADNAIGLADIENVKQLPGNDSIVQALYMQAAEMGHKSGDRAALMTAIKCYENKNYEEALKYLNKASGNSSIVEAGRYSLMGDCYVNLNKYEEAINCFNKGVKAADNNPQIVPFILVKEANVYHELNKHAEEYAAYNRILTDFPAYVNSHRNINIQKLAERAKAAAAAK